MKIKILRIKYGLRTSGFCVFLFSGFPGRTWTLLGADTVLRPPWLCLYRVFHNHFPPIFTYGLKGILGPENCRSPCSTWALLHAKVVEPPRLKVHPHLCVKLLALTRYLWNCYCPYVGFFGFHFTFETKQIFRIVPLNAKLCLCNERSMSLTIC